MVMLANKIPKINPQNRTEGLSEVTLSMEKVQIQTAYEVGFNQWHGLQTRPSRGSKSPG